MARREIYQQNWDVPCCFGPSTLGPGYLDGDHGSTDCFTRPVNTVTWAPSCGGFPYLFIYDYFLSFQLTQWTWVWVNSRSWWWIGRPGMLWFMGSQRVRHDWATELNWMLKCSIISINFKQNLLMIKLLFTCYFLLFLFLWAEVSVKVHMLKS